MRSQVRELGIAGAVVTTGGLPREEALERYSYADIFAFPSMTDTQALVLNEAAYMHLPLVYSDADLSLVAEDGVSGVLVAPEPEAFAKTLLELADDPDRCQKLGDAAHKKACEYTISKQAKKLEEIYKRIS
jgi:glycosyltransferase involved in cell wall biosynthesis